MQQNKIIIVLVLLVLVNIGVYYFSTNKASAPSVQNEVQTPSPQSGAAAPTTNTSQDVSVAISNYSFQPATLTIKPGTKVTWINNDGAQHTITSDVGSTLRSQTLGQGQSFSFVFDQAGTTSYHCSIHPGMRGSITVQN